MQLSTSSYNNMPSISKSLYSPIQNPCHISVLFLYLSSFLSISVIFPPPKKKKTPTITEIDSKMTCII